MAPFSLTIRLSSGARFEVSIPVETDPTVQDVKEAIARLQTDTPVERQRLIHQGKILSENTHTLASYGIASQATLFLVKSRAGGSGGGGTAGGGAVQSSFRAAAPVVPPPAAATQTANRTNNNMPMDPFSMPQPDPETMQAMMNSPMLQNLLDNPQVMQNLLQTQLQHNPSLQRMLEQNPQLRHMLDDPSVMEQAIQMMRNPSTRQQALRQQDLALSQLENLPGGFAALRNMYRDLQEPLEEAMGGAETSTTSSSSNNNSSTQGASGAAMPNPWGSPRASTTTGTPVGGLLGSRTATISNSTPAAANPWAAPSAPNPWASSPSGSSSTSNSNPWAAAANNNPWAAAGMPPMPSPEQTNAMMGMLDNPMVQQMLRQTIHQNPDMFRQLLEAQNPMMRQMFQNNPEGANDFVRRLMDPDAMRSILQLQQQLAPPRDSSAAGLDFSSLLQQPPGGGGMDWSALMQQQPGGGGGMDFGSFLQGLQPSGAPSNVAPADRYQVQLRSLYDMGFDDEQRNLTALQRAQGNLNRAVDMLIGGEVPATSAAAAPSETNNDAPSEPKDATEKKND